MTRLVMLLLRHRLAGIVCSRLVASATGMLVGIALARALGPAGLGDYANLVAVAGVVGALCCMGMEVPYNLAATADRHGGGNLLRLAAMQAACALPVAGLIWLALDRAGGAPDASPLLFALVTATFVLNQLAQPVLSGLQQQVWANLAMAGLLAVQAGTIMLLAAQALASLTTTAALYSLVLATLGLGALACRWNERRAGFSYRETFRDLFAQGRHYLLATLGGVLRLRIGIVLMGLYLPAHDIGNYQVMQALTEVLYLVPVTVSTYVLSARGSASMLAREAARAALASCAITVFCVAGLAIALPVVIPFLYGPGFAAVVAHGPLMLTGAIAFALAKGVAAYFSRMGWSRLVMRVEIATTAVAFAAFAALVPAGGLAGAVRAFVAASWFGAFAYLWILVGMIVRGTAIGPASQEPGLT